MSIPDHMVYDDDATFDVVWMRVSDNDQETGRGEVQHDGIFQVGPAFLSAPISTAQGASIPVIVTFTWDTVSAKFACDCDLANRSYKNFTLVPTSMSPDFAVAFFSVDWFQRDAQPCILELAEGLDGAWKMEMLTMLDGPRPLHVEVWAKRRKDGVPAIATDSDLRNWKLGPYASVNEEDEEEDWEEERNHEVCSSEEESDESDPEGQAQDVKKGEDQEMDSDEDRSDAEDETKAGEEGEDQEVDPSEDMSVAEASQKEEHSEDSGNESWRDLDGRKLL